MPGRGGGMGKRCMCGSGIPGGRWRGIIPGLEPRRPGGDCMPIPAGPPGGTWFPELNPSMPSLLILGPIPAGSFDRSSTELPTGGMPIPAVGGGGPVAPRGGMAPGGRNPGGICMGLKPGRMKGPGGGGTPGGNEGGGMFMGPGNPGGGTLTAPIG